MAVWTPLESSWAKFNRAGLHLQNLDDEIGRVMSQEAEAVVIERHIKGSEASLRVTRCPDFRDAGMMLGDTVTNYRAALDHLAWDLVKMGTHPRLTPKQATYVQFPLAKSWLSLKGQRGQRVPGISDEEWAIIRAYQPYRSDDRGRAMRLLRNLSDTDKHRYIVPAAFAATEFRGRINLVRCTAESIWVRRPNRALHVGVKLVQLQIIDAAADFDVQIESQITLQPSLSHGVPVMPTMMRVRDTVFAVLSAVERRF